MLRSTKWQFFLLFFCIPHISQASFSNAHLMFENISVEKGLSAKNVFCITQDKDGYMWFGTNNGLNRYDGYTFKNYFHEFENPNSLTNSNINCLLCDSKGRLWVGTDMGINLYDKNNDDFYVPNITGDSNKELARRRIRSIFEDSRGYIWIGTQVGLIRYDTNQQLVTFYSFPMFGTEAHRNIIRSIAEDKNHIIWLGTFDGQISLNVESGEIQYFNLRKRLSFDPKNNLTLRIVKDPVNQDRIWFATETGLHYYDTETKKNITFRKEDKKEGLCHNNVEDILHLDESRYLIATSAGLNILDLKNNHFSWFEHNIYDRLSVSANIINALYKDRGEIVWVGTANGISKLNPFRDRLSVYNFKNERNNNEEMVKSIRVLSNGERWLIVQNKVIRIQKDGTINQATFENSRELIIRTLFIDPFEVMWITTSNGLYYCEKGQTIFKSVSKLDSTFTQRFVNAITWDDSGSMWVNTYNGICRIDIERGKDNKLLRAKREEYKIDNAPSHANVEIHAIQADKRGKIWFGVNNNGIYAFDIKSRTFQHFKTLIEGRTTYSMHVRTILSGSKGEVCALTERGLCFYDSVKVKFVLHSVSLKIDRQLQAAVMDKNENIWLTAYHQLIRVDQKIKENSVFDLSNLLDINGFVVRSLYLDDSGVIWAGSYNSYISFIPNQIKIHDNESVLRITEVSVWDRDVHVPPGTKDEIIPTLKFSHKDNFIKISFAQLNYLPHSSNQYSYKLDGIDDEWQKPYENQNFAAYANLAPGYYTFRVKNTNNENANNEATLQIYITPPWWYRTYALIAYVLIFIIIAYFIGKLIKNRIELARALQMKRLEAEKTEEISQLKLRFFTNISHELRTPLTLVVSPIDGLIQRVNDISIKNQLITMKSNAERLLRMVNQILDFRKIENKQMQLTLSTRDFPAFLRSIFSMFEVEAKKRSIAYTFKTSIKSYTTEFDTDKIEKVIFNIVSNAFKFTPDEGKITLSFDVDIINNEQCVIVKVEDSGMGIPENEISYIFERFYQSSGGQSYSIVGTGIGLALAKDLTELHGGQISVHNNPDVGATFKISLPFRESEILYDEPDEKTDELRIDSTPSRPSIVIVEDNKDLSDYMLQLFSENYIVYCCKHGEEGFEVINKVMPDIILSDIMMPVMDGWELCKKVKSDIALSHIPLILITAKAGDENIYKGLEYGADEYIVKPFNERLLLLRVEKIINQRKQIHNYYQRFFQDKNNEDVTITVDPFLQQIIEIVETDIQNSTIDISYICEHIKLPAHQVYRKIKAITGNTVVELIRAIRLRKAAEMLKETDFSVSEILYDNGFTTPSYFSKRFFDMYGMTPKEYREQFKKIIS